MKTFIQDWIYAGPFELDVSDRYTDNYKVPFAPYSPLFQEAGENLQACETAKENDAVDLFGQKGLWKLYRMSEGESRVTWAGFGTYARLLSTYAGTDITAEKDGMLHLHFWLSGSAVVTVNGKEVFRRMDLGRVEGNFDFEVPVHKGKNRIIILLMNVHLHCINSFSLWAEEPVLAEPPISQAVRDRDLLEQDFQAFYFSQRLVCPGECLYLCTDGSLKCPGSFGYQTADGREVLLERGDVPVHAEVNGDDQDGAYEIALFYRAGEEKIWGPVLRFERVSFWEDIPADACWETRREYLLNRIATLDCSGRNGVFGELAKLAAGRPQEVDEGKIRQTIDYINSRYDCADFALHGILRLYAMYHESPSLSGQLKKELKDCILNFRYWVDEPGPSMMFTRSENHEMLFYSAEYIAGILFPTEVFPNSGQNGLFHTLKGRIQAEQWIREKGTFGFTEWHSNTYYEEDMLALLTIYDFGEENGLMRVLARELMDLISIFIASHSYEGIMATTHGRCYEGALLYPQTEAMSRLNWLLMGYPRKLINKLSIGALALACSRYRPPEVVSKLADPSQELDTKTNMGLFRSDMQGVSCFTSRTPYFMLSGMVESKAGEHGGQVQAGQALLNGKVPVFVTCFDNKSETTRPSYWGGQYRNPKTIAGKHTLAYIYRIQEDIGCTHCYFPMNSFDEVVRQGKWLFGCVDGAYIGVYCHKPYEIIRGGEFQNRELLCYDHDTIWLLELGDCGQYPTFQDFIRAFPDDCIKEEETGIRYQSPSGKIYQLGWDCICTEDGTPIRQPPFSMIENKFVASEYGSGITEIHDGKKEWRLHFRF